MTDEQLPPGIRLGTEFVVERTLGAGAFGITYLVRAIDDITDEVMEGDLCVVKECYPSAFVRRDGARVTAAGSPAKAKANAARFHDIRRWFIDEAMTLSSFFHPSIVRVFLLRQANSTAYMVMEYIEGKSLEDLIRDRIAETSKPLEFATLVSLARPLIEALEAVHKENIIHRDIKPSNIMLRQDGSPVLIDFGGAKPMEQANQSVVLTPAFAPREQMLGRDIGPWTDIYSLAATLYFALIGRPPVITINDSLVHVPLAIHPLREAYGIPLDFAEAIDCALEPDWGDRVKSVAEWRAKLLPSKAPVPPAPTAWPDLGGAQPPPLLIEQAKGLVARSGLSRTAIGLIICLGILLLSLLTLLVLGPGDPAKARQTVAVSDETWTPVEVAGLDPDDRVGFVADKPFRLRVNGEVYSFTDSSRVVAPDIPPGATVELKAVSDPTDVSIYAY